MKPNQRQSTADNWCVSTSGVAHLPVVELNVYQRRGNKFQDGQAHGLCFTDTDAAFAYAAEHGYLKPYGRNVISFHSNRSFRKHTGLESMTPDDVLWQLHMRANKR